jgi:site-specific DNA-cytosine methylase
MTLIIDLCCGIGRFPGLNVVSIDIDPKTHPTIIADVNYLPLRERLKPALVHASPPCKYLSHAHARRYGYDPQGIAESLRLVAACFDAFNYLRAVNWTLENPFGVLRRIMPTDIETEYEAHDYKHKKTNFWSNMRSLKRALIPLDVRQRILEEVGRE